MTLPDRTGGGRLALLSPEPAPLTHESLVALDHERTLGFEPVVDHDARELVEGVHLHLYSGADADVRRARDVLAALSGADGLLRGVVALPAEFCARPPGLVMTDADSTLIQQEVIEEFADFAGTRDLVKALTDHAMRGNVDFATSLRERVSTLYGLREYTILDVQRRVRLTAGAEDLVRTTHRLGGRFGVVSGGFEEVLAPLVEELRIDHVAANRLGVLNGRLTGLVEGRIVTAEVKLECLHTWAVEHEVPLSATLAVGDGANDIPMLTSAGVGIAFCAKPAVREAVVNRVDVPRLDVVAVLLGNGS